MFTNTAVARKNMLWGPGGWGVNFGLHKDFKFGERVTAALGADFDNIFNHPIRMPNQDFGDSSFAYLGGFNIKVDPSTLQPTLQSGDDCGNQVGQLCLSPNLICPSILHIFAGGRFRPPDHPATAASHLLANRKF